MPALSFAKTLFEGDPGELLPARTVMAQTDEVARTLIEDEGWRNYLNLEIGHPIEIIGIRSFARPGPDSMTEFGTVVELVDRRTSDIDRSGYLAGAGYCLVFNSAGVLTSGAYVSRGSGDTHDVKFQNRVRFCASGEGQRRWSGGLHRGPLQLRAATLYQQLCVR